MRQRKGQKSGKDERKVGPINIFWQSGLSVMIKSFEIFQNNHYCLEVMQSNMDVKLNPTRSLVMRLAAREMREICESEAFFWLDRQMHMSD